MGYDDNECIICYLNTGCNNTTDFKYSVCMTCINDENYGHYTGRVAAAVKDNMSGYERCCICGEEGITTELGLCELHMKQKEKDCPDKTKAESDSESD